jgi:Ca2+/Na+ antiporter
MLLSTLFLLSGLVLLEAWAEAALILFGFVALLAGARLLVNGAKAVAVRFGISEVGSPR